MAYRRTYVDDSDDEIVWSLSDGRDSLETGASSPSYSLVSDCSSDFIVLSRPLSPFFHADPPIYQSRPSAGLQQHTPLTASFNLPLTEQVAKLRISGGPKGSANKRAKKANPAVFRNAGNQPASTKKARKKDKQTVNPYPSPSPSPKARQTAVPTPAKPKKDHRNKASNTTKSTGRRSNPIIGKSVVQPVVAASTKAAEVPSLYEEASTFISRFLSSPEAKNNSVCRLTLLQSLIVELGLATSNLPASLTSARAFLKSRAFLNIREYVAVRNQGPDAIKRAMYPTKSALVKNVRKKGNRAPLQWVKDIGLQVLLVDRMH